MLQYTRYHFVEVSHLQGQKTMVDLPLGLVPFVDFPPAVLESAFERKPEYRL